jgi:cytochrome c oxidase cbb3-type subunit 3
LGLALIGSLALAQSPSGDGMSRPSDEADRGATLFRATCGFCHGAEGGGAQGPNLTVSRFFIADDRGRSLADFLKIGRPGSGMPAFATLPPADTAAMHAYIRARAASGPRRAAFSPQSILVGDAAAGRLYFEGKGGCSACHSVTGDLKGVGARYNPVVLQGRIVNPRIVGVGRGGPAPTPPAAKVKVTLGKDQVVSGALVQVNDFFVTLTDDKGMSRTFERKGAVPKVEIDDPIEVHRRMMLTWTDESLWNITTYLAGVK